MDTIVSRIQELGDLELAILLSLVAQQHCIITGKNDLLDNLAQELSLVRTMHAQAFPTPDHSRSSSARLLQESSVSPAPY